MHWTLPFCIAQCRVECFSADFLCERGLVLELRFPAVLIVPETNINPCVTERILRLPDRGI